MATDPDDRARAVNPTALTTACRFRGPPAGEAAVYH